MRRVVFGKELFLSEVLTAAAEVRHMKTISSFVDYLNGRAQDTMVRSVRIPGISESDRMRQGISDPDSLCCGPWSKSGSNGLRTVISPLGLFTTGLICGRLIVYD